MQNAKLAFLFPGQGSQKIGMLSQLAGQRPAILETFAQASATLGYDLWELIQNGEQDAINLTERTQPALLTASVALWRLWLQSGGPNPAIFAGHSLGEWSALVCAGVVEFTDAVALVRLRGKYMQEAVPVGTGAMAAIMGLDDEVIRNCCSLAADGEVVGPVNFNAPGQVVIAGTTGAVERAIAACKDAGAKRALALPVSAPFHTTLMEPAARRLAEHITATEFHPPQIPVIHNVNARAEADPQAIKQLMIEQIYQPVLWVDCVNQLVSAGIELAVECGAGKVLGGLNKRITPQLTSLATEDVDSFDRALAAV